jgi:hypothetical protein
MVLYILHLRTFKKPIIYKMKKQIFNLLKKYYLHFNEKKFSELLSCKTDEETYDIFQKLWKKEHGGLYRIDNLDETFNPPETLPYYKDNQIIITDTGSNSKKFHRLYIKKLNELILNSKSSTLNLNFSNNGGGKPQVMIAGLLPIFNNFDISTLAYYYDKNMKLHYDVKRNDNKIICISNNNSESVGTRKKYNVIELNIYYNNFTVSSAEQSIICLLSLSKYIKINLIGNKTAGFTTVNKYIKLSDKYGIEIPIGYMGTKQKIYYKGI